MNNVLLNLVVIPSVDIQRSLAFYQSLGLSFVAERHGKGPVHFAAELGSTIFEIYPQQTVAGNVRSSQNRISRRVR